MHSKAQLVGLHLVNTMILGNHTQQRCLYLPGISGYIVNKPGFTENLPHWAFSRQWATKYFLCRKNPNNIDFSSAAVLLIKWFCGFLIISALTCFTFPLPIFPKGTTEV